MPGGFLVPVGDVFLATGHFLFAGLEFRAPELSPVQCELDFAAFCLFDCICFHIKSICRHSEEVLVPNCVITHE